MQYDNKVKKLHKKDGFGMYICMQCDIQPPRTITGHILIHYSNSTSLLDIAMYFNIHYFKKCNIKKMAFINLHKVIILPLYYHQAYHCTVRYSYISQCILICTYIKHLTFKKTSFINIYMAIMAHYYHHAYIVAIS